MKVLVWKSYGDIKVYAAETAEQLEGIIDTMMCCIEGWGEDKKIAMVKAHIEKHKGDHKEMMRAFNTIKNATGEGSDQFEDIFLTDVSETCQ
jgi:hypothetical protein